MMQMDLSAKQQQRHRHREQTHGCGEDSGGLDLTACPAAKSLQPYPTLCDPADGSLQAPCSWDSPGRNTGGGCHFLLQCRKVKRESEVAQSCPTLSDPIDCSPSGSSVHGIVQARALEWGAFAFSETHTHSCV